MQILEIMPLGNGSHRNHTYHGILPEGWALIPDEMEPNMENFPFGDVEVEEMEVEGIGMVPVVTKWIPGPLPEPAIDLESIAAEKVAQSKEDLAAYLDTHPMTWTDGNQYSVTAEKQSLLTSQLALYQTAAAMGQPYPLEWNTTGGECTEWTYENLVALAFSISSYVKPLVSYQQAKEIEIMNCKTLEELEAVVVDYETLA